MADADGKRAIDFETLSPVPDRQQAWLLEDQSVLWCSEAKHYAQDPGTQALVCLHRVHGRRLGDQPAVQTRLR